MALGNTPDLWLSGSRVLEGLNPQLELEQRSRAILLRGPNPDAASRLELRIGKLTSVTRYLALHRASAFWLAPRFGAGLAASQGGLPPGTEFVLAELETGNFALLVPLTVAPFVVTLESRGDTLWAVADSGALGVSAPVAQLLLVLVGSDVYELMSAGAHAVAAATGTNGLRGEHAPPALAEKLGWCTWDAFYREVTGEDVLNGVRALRSGGIQPGFVIVDDGWQTTQTSPARETQLTSVLPSDQFARDLAPTVSGLKELGVRWVLVWHAIHGAFGGVARELHPYSVSWIPRRNPAEVLAHRPDANREWFGPGIGVPGWEQLHTFYEQLHGMLAKAGVDGVKVDNLASVDAIAHATGGRVATAQSTLQKLFHSTRTHFQNTSLACMACTNTLTHRLPAGQLLRTSDDFWPARADSHGQHAQTNASVSLWLGEFAWPDWDMFQSQHAAGAFHAALRAVSGGPVYVSDAPGNHDFALLRQLTTEDGGILRARRPGRPTLDCVFTDCCRTPVPLKIWNENLGSGVLGVFNVFAHTDPATPPGLEGTLCAGDVPTLEGQDFVLLFHQSGACVQSSRAKLHSIRLHALDWELVTIVPIDGGVAPLGLLDKLNGAAAITAKSWRGAHYCVALKSAGLFGVWCAARPAAVRLNGAAIPFTFESGVVKARLSRCAGYEVTLEFAT